MLKPTELHGVEVEEGQEGYFTNAAPERGLTLANIMLRTATTNGRIPEELKTVAGEINWAARTIVAKMTTHDLTQIDDSRREFHTRQFGMAVATVATIDALVLMKHLGDEDLQYPPTPGSTVGPTPPGPPPSSAPVPVRVPTPSPTLAPGAIPAI